MKHARGNVRKLLIVIGKLQSLIGKAESEHQNDRSRDGFEHGQKALRQAFDLCIEATSQYHPVVEKKQEPHP